MWSPLPGSLGCSLPWCRFLSLSVSRHQTVAAAKKENTDPLQILSRISRKRKVVLQPAFTVNQDKRKICPVTWWLRKVQLLGTYWFTNSIKRTFYSSFTHWSREKVLQPENIFQNICYKIMNNNFSESNQKSSVKQKLSAEHTFSYIKWHWVDVNSFSSVTLSWKASWKYWKAWSNCIRKQYLFNLILVLYKVLLAWGIHFLQLSLNRNACLAIWGLALN